MVIQESQKGIRVSWEEDLCEELGFFSIRASFFQDASILAPFD